MRNYKVIHLIQGSGLEKSAENVVVRAFNKMYDSREPDGCLSTSVSLCIALEYLGYAPKLCIGKYWVEGHDFYHAWTELDGKIIDISIYGNTCFSQYWPYGIVLPQINKSYSETDVKYEPFAFDEDFKRAQIAQAIGRSFFTYCDMAPKHNAIWNLILYYLNTTSLSALQAVKEIAKKHVIGERGDIDDKPETEV